MPHLEKRLAKLPMSIQDRHEKRVKKIEKIQTQGVKDLKKTLKVS